MQQRNQSPQKSTAKKQKGDDSEEEEESEKDEEEVPEKPATKPDKSRVFPLYNYDNNYNLW